MNLDGIININKPQNMTSHDVVRRLRRLFGMKKIGHTGTLDPMATGVLPVCLGSATRITEYLDLDFKTYRCTMMLGMNTDTQDVWGEKTGEFDTSRVTEEAVRDAFRPFHGEILQTPPMYSAVRVDGRRLYEYARAGETVDVKSRKIFIRALTVDAVDLRAMTVTFTVECSKGTYIRTICQDVGTALGTGAVMTSLVRLASGRFRIEDAVTLEELEKGKKTACQGIENEEASESWPGNILLPPDYPLIHFGRAVLDPAMSRKFTDGWHIPMKDCRIEAEPEFAHRKPEQTIRDEYRRAWCLYREAENGEESPQFLGVAFYDLQYKKLVADKVFFRGDWNENI
ncbi:MAG: tRNA pseudouridine(55) synthase TruB [Firmicutes bacterium]|nr:tRNA pseudouridine(55) synthase TruB [Bacillota bacterium]MDY5855492.1 tRNA pseudouridine(55) synthase TruB [Anaerovoracaceae bacterium]